MRTVTPGVNDLATRSPAVAEQWHPEKNGDLTPDRVAAGSDRRRWWLCEHGHEWLARVANRAAGAGCPTCARRGAPRRGPNRLSDQHPRTAARWHPTKNGDLRPADVTGGSNQVVWWLGECGHEWQRDVFEETTRRHPVCSPCVHEQRWGRVPAR